MRALGPMLAVVLLGVLATRPTAGLPAGGPLNRVNTFYDTTSILKLIETRWNLRPLGPRDAAAHDLTAALDLR